MNLGIGSEKCFTVTPSVFQPEFFGVINLPHPNQAIYIGFGMASLLICYWRMLISIIVPTLNTADSLPVALHQLAHRADVELLIVDGGSTDRTVEVAQSFTPYVFQSRPNRAAQFNTGAQHATGDILFFMPADAFLLPGALEDLQQQIITHGAVAGAFDLTIDSSRRVDRLMAWLANRRARLWRSPAGDQGLFLWRQVFAVLGGFPEFPILEDGAVARQLRSVGRVVFLRTGLVTSRRRWKTHGIVSSLCLDWWVRFLYCLRIPPGVLRRIADGWLKPAVNADSTRQSTCVVVQSSRD